MTFLQARDHVFKPLTLAGRELQGLRLAWQQCGLDSLETMF